VLTEPEEAAVRQSGAQELYVKYNVWTGMWTQEQVVIVIAGSDRSNTRAAEARHSETVKSRILGVEALTAASG